MGPRTRAEGRTGKATGMGLQKSQGNAKWDSASLQRIKEEA